jgi:hypothetical protein
MRARSVATALAALSFCITGITGAESLPTRLPAAGFDARDRDDPLELPAKDAERLRRDALSRALIWLEPAEPVELVDLGRNPDDVLGRAEEVACKFHLDKTSGASPKFECVFEGGEVLKVKYGRSAEVHTEVAATRLMRALGAGADRMYLVKRLRCFGCPEDPHAMLNCLSSPFEEHVRQCGLAHGGETKKGELVVRLDYAKYTDFTTVAVERRAEGRAIKANGTTGWGFDEFDELPPGRGEVLRAERDALRLLAVFLNNWDNRSDNQRLLCLDDGARLADGGCLTPLAYMHDVGATFGHVGGAKGERKLDVEGWRAAPIWKDRAACTVSIESPRFHGATFGEATISERGRQFLAERLRRIGDEQARALFEGARFAEYEDASAQSRDVEQWVQAFQEKVREITSGEPCPT